MKKNDEKIFVLYILLTVFIVLKNIVLIPLSAKTFNYIINPIFWIVILLYCYHLFKNVYGRYKNKYDKIQLIVILLLIYLIMYFSSGLILGYEKSPYSLDLISILKNIWAFILTVFCEEYARYSIIKESRKKFISYLFITFVFCMLEINFVTLFYNFKTIPLAIEYTSSTLLPLIAKNALLTYLIATGGITLALIYKVFMQAMLILLPIFPKLNWFIEGGIGISLPLIAYLTINNFIDKKNIKFYRQKGGQSNPVTSIPIYLFVGILILFFYGTFKYRPVGVMSNSMYPVFQRGDAVIIETITPKNIKSIEIGTVIMYNLNEAPVIHRVIEVIYKDGVILYRTKGDNNDAPDTKLVTQNQVMGIQKISIPKIGYPSVWLQSILSKKEVGVQT